MILERTKWTTNVDFMAKDIFEYDMKRGGLSIIKEKKLLPEEEIKKIMAMEKQEANEYIGKLKYTHKDLHKELNEYFKEYRLLFGEMNDLTDNDIVSVKKDAIFTTRYCEHQQLTENIIFREKNYYTSFLQINHIEIYRGDKGLDVKNISDENVELHREGILRVIDRLMTYLGQYDNRGYIQYLVMVMNDYKFRRLPLEYYRSFDSESKFFYVNDEYQSIVKYVEESDLGQLDISYNYMNVLVPLLNMVSM